MLISVFDLIPVAFTRTWKASEKPLCWDVSIFIISLSEIIHPNMLLILAIERKRHLVKSFLCLGREVSEGPFLKFTCHLGSQELDLRHNIHYCLAINISHWIARPLSSNPESFWGQNMWKGSSTWSEDATCRGKIRSVITASHIALGFPSITMVKTTEIGKIATALCNTVTGSVQYSNMKWCYHICAIIPPLFSSAAWAGESQQWWGIACW